MLDALARLSTSAVRQVRIKNAFAPLIYFCVPVVAITILGALEFLKSAPALSVLLIIIAILVIFFALGMYLFFAVRNPGMLQSEDYQLRHETLEIVRQKTGELQIDSKSLPVFLRVAGHIESPDDEGRE